MKILVLTALTIAAINFSVSAQTMNKLSSAEKSEGYKLLFNGSTTYGWHIYNGKGPGAWGVKNGALQLDTGAQGQGDLVTDKEYKNYELKLDWKIDKGGNSGVIFSVHEDTSLAYTFLTGMEMQVLDDKEAEDNKQPDHLAGSLYDMIAPAHPAKPAGEWNSIIIRKLDGHLTFYMNGQKVVDVQMGSPEWNEVYKKSKFTRWKSFATYQTGHIALQDHGAIVAFRNIRIKQL
jgi:hypothetical protein